MPQANLAQNQVITIQLSQFYNGAVAVATSVNANAGITVDLQVQSVAGEWITIGTFDPVARASQAHITGNGKTGWADVPGYRAVQVIRTDANGGNGTTSIEFREC